MRPLARFLFKPKVTACLVCVGLLSFVGAFALSWSHLEEAEWGEFSDDIANAFKRQGGDLVFVEGLGNPSIRSPQMVRWKFPLLNRAVSTSLDMGQRITISTRFGRCLVDLRTVNGRVSFYEIASPTPAFPLATAALEELKNRYPGVAWRITERLGP